jgi:hypothetical protein
MIRSLIFETKPGNVSIKLSGAMFSIAGAPVQTLSWQLRPDLKSISISFESQSIKCHINEDYLISLVDVLEKALAAFVLKKD